MFALLIPLSAPMLYSLLLYCQLFSSHQPLRDRMTAKWTSHYKLIYLIPVLPMLQHCNSAKGSCYRDTRVPYFIQFPFTHDSKWHWITIFKVKCTPYTEHICDSRMCITEIRVKNQSYTEIEWTVAPSSIRLKCDFKLLYAMKWIYTLRIITQLHNIHTHIPA